MEQAQPVQTAHHYEIFVNTRRKDVDTRVLTFTQVCQLAYPDPGPDPTFTVTFKNADQPTRDGLLTQGQTVTLKDGTMFDVRKTNKS